MDDNNNNNKKARENVEKKNKKKLQIKPQPVGRSLARSNVKKL